MKSKGFQGRVVSFKNARLIVERNDTQRIVKQIRKHWNIPTDGINNFKDYLVWSNNLIGQLINIDKDDIKTITEYEFNFNGKSFTLARIIESKIMGISGKISKYSLFLQEVSDACKMLKLPLFWKSFLFSYITQGKIKESILIRSGKTHNTPSVRAVRVKNAEGKEGERKVRLEFGANTTFKDIKFVWKDVKKIQQTMTEYDKTRRRTNLLRDLDALELKRGGKTHKDIFQEASYESSFPSEQAVAKALQRKKKIIKGQ